MLQIFTLFFAATLQTSQAATTDWTVTNDWSPTYEQKFSEFVQTLGESGCNSLHSCLTSAKSNPAYINKTPVIAGHKYFADCADLPFALRMYFSWMEGLPFDYVDDVEQAEPSKETSTDIRYTKYGNKPYSTKKFIKGKVYNGFQSLHDMTDMVSTATYRMHHQYISDFYPPAIDLKNIRPGTVLYDPAGHAAMIYKIESDGRIHMIDAHPDQSLTHITFDKKFERSRQAHGAGFKNWRPDLNTQPTNTQPGFSLDQFEPNYIVNGRTVDYYDYVRVQMAGGNLQFNPVTELQNSMLETCSNIHDRINAVNQSIKNQIDKKDHPAKLPTNIYGTSGEWEEFSTPSRDARLKVAFVSMLEDSLRLIKKFEDGDSSVVYEVKPSKYSGQCRANDKVCFLIASMLEEFEQTEADPSCQFSYKNSAGTSVAFSYSDVVEKLFDLSFDPYHCIERRWGATQAQELATCQDNQNKTAWYAAEQGLRNQIERTYDAKMDFDVNGTKGLGVSVAPDVDLYVRLKALLNR